MENPIGSGNINERWLNNVYENIKNLENYERLIREGCSSLLDFMQIPLSSRQVIIGATQFKNLKFIITEFRLLLADLSPVLTEKAKIDKFNIILDRIEEAIKNESLFISEKRNASREIIEIKPTELFYDTIKVLHKLKIELFIEIKSILYIQDNNEW